MRRKRGNGEAGELQILMFLLTDKKKVHLIVCDPVKLSQNQSRFFHTLTLGQVIRLAQSHHYKPKGSHSVQIPERSNGEV